MPHDHPADRHRTTTGEAFKKEIHDEIKATYNKLRRLTDIAAEQLGESHKITIVSYPEGQPIPVKFTYGFWHHHPGIIPQHTNTPDQPINQTP